MDEGKLKNKKKKKKNEQKIVGEIFSSFLVNMKLILINAINFQRFFNKLLNYPGKLSNWIWKIEKLKKIPFRFLKFIFNCFLPFKYPRHTSNIVCSNILVQEICMQLKLLYFVMQGNFSHEFIKSGPFHFLKIKNTNWKSYLKHWELVFMTCKNDQIFILKYPYILLHQTIIN